MNLDTEHHIFPSVKPANKRGAARLAAVQALYQMEITSIDVSEIVAEYETLRLGKELDGDDYLAADSAWFRSLVVGVVEQQTVIDPLIGNTLPSNWPFSRISMILRAILRAGLFELNNKTDVPAAVIISEYVDIAKAFFHDGEPGMVNGVLHKIAHADKAE